MKNLVAQAKKIKLVIFDVDGVLTNGVLVYNKDGHELKEFHVHDGQGIKLLLQARIEVAIITTCRSTIVAKRMHDLGIQHVYQNQTDKLMAYEDLKKKLNLTDEQILYVGDDFPDLPVMARVGLSITVANAPAIMQKHAMATTIAKGGKGAAREICDFVLESQNLYQSLLKPYLS